MIKAAREYLKQWLILLYLIPSTFSVMQTYFKEAINDYVWLSWINNLSQLLIFSLFIFISVFAGIRITKIKNDLLEGLENKIEFQEHSKQPININIMGDIHLNAPQGQYINSNVIKGDISIISMNNEYK